MDEFEPEFFLKSGIVAEPDLEVAVGLLPVLPNETGRIDGAGFGAEIIGIEGFGNEGKIGGFGDFKIIEHEFGVLGEIEFLVETAFFCVFGEIEFVDRRIESAVDGHEF